MIPKEMFDQRLNEFEKEIKALGKRAFLEFRKQFRSFAVTISAENYPEGLKGYEIKDILRRVSQKLHSIKQENDRREIIDRIHQKIAYMIHSPEETTMLDDNDFKEAIHHMENATLKKFSSAFKKANFKIMDSDHNTKDHPFSKHELRILKQWDFIECELVERKRAQELENNLDQNREGTPATR